MSKTRSRQSDTRQDGNIGPAFTSESMDVMSEAFAGWLQNATRLQAEAIRFFQDRVNKDIEMFSSLAQCKSPGELFELQSKMASGLVSDYMSESARMLELMGSVAQEQLGRIVKTGTTTSSGD